MNSEKILQPQSGTTDLIAPPSVDLASIHFTCPAEYPDDPGLLKGISETFLGH